MKKYLHLYLIVAFVAISLISGTLYSSSSPGAKSGSPLDGSDCTQCHSGSEIKTVDWLSTNIPETGWIPEQTYIITAVASHETAPVIGFELTAENESLKTGTFTITDADRTKLINQSKAVTHTAAGHTPTDGQISWEVEWTAPNRDRGDITFYAAFNGANGNGSTSGDEISTSALTVSQDASTTDIADASIQSFSAYPNPTKGMVFIESPIEISALNIFSISGQQIRSISSVNSTYLSVDLSNEKPGLYLINATTENGELVQKLQLK